MVRPKRNVQPLRPQLPHRLAKLEGWAVRRVYRALLSVVVRRSVVIPRSVMLSVFSLSCERDLPEQVASVRSFLRHVGQPVAFTIVSDGSHSSRSCDLLRRIHSCVRVVDWREMLRPDVPQCVHAYAKVHPFGKKLALEFSIPVSHTTIYTDSDVLFFTAARDLAGYDSMQDGRGWYLPDCRSFMDEQILACTDEADSPINAGFFILHEAVDWKPALDRLANLAERGAEFHPHTEQTVVHLTMHGSKVQPLDSRRYVVSIDDQLSCKDAYARHSIALRHYTTPVRHKFWCRLGRSLLSRELA